MNSADVKCNECDEIFCNSCSEKLHNSAKGLQKHKTYSLNYKESPETLDFCHVHHEAVLDFFCEDCDQFICCYCALEDHVNHSRNNVTVLVKNNQYKVYFV